MTWTGALIAAGYVVGWFVAVRIVHTKGFDDDDGFVAVMIGLLWPVIAGFAAVVGVIYGLYWLAVHPLPSLRRRSVAADPDRIAELERELDLGSES